VLANADDCDVVVMAAAVADFRPKAAAGEKLKKGDGVPELVLEPTVDILAALGARKRPGQVVVGFAAETGDAHGTPLDYGRDKLARKGCDLLVVNRVDEGRAFEVPDNAGVILSAHAAPPVRIPLGPKTVLAAAVCDAIAGCLARCPGAAPPVHSRPPGPPQGDPEPPG